MTKSLKTTPDDLIQIPKVELHRHLECSMRLSTFRELAIHAGLDVPKAESELKKQFLVTEPMLDLEAVLKKFLATQKVLSSQEILTRITFEAIEDASREGIRILELRYAPTFIQQGHEDLSFEQIHRAILEGAEMAKHLPIAVGFIATIQRILPVSEGARVTDFAIDHKDSFIGLDLADNEAGSAPQLFEKLFDRARANGLHATVHAGEADIPESAANVRAAIEVLGAERIGHGVQIYRSPETIEFVRNRKVPLELCPTSNYLTNAVPSTAKHPFRKLMEDGVLVTINSDDPGVFDIDLVNEYRVLKTEHGLTREEFDRCNDVAAEYSFIPLEKKQKYWPRPIRR